MTRITFPSELKVMLIGGSGFFTEMKVRVEI